MPANIPRNEATNLEFGVAKDEMQTDGSGTANVPFKIYGESASAGIDITVEGNAVCSAHAETILIEDKMSPFQSLCCNLLMDTLENEREFLYVV